MHLFMGIRYVIPNFIKSIVNPIGVSLFYTVPYVNIDVFYLEVAEEHK